MTKIIIYVLTINQLEYFFTLINLNYNAIFDSFRILKVFVKQKQKQRTFMKKDERINIKPNQIRIRFYELSYW